MAARMGMRTQEHLHSRSPQSSGGHVEARRPSAHPCAQYSPPTRPFLPSQSTTPLSTTHLSISPTTTASSFPIPHPPSSPIHPRPLNLGGCATGRHCGSGSPSRLCASEPPVYPGDSFTAGGRSASFTALRPCTRAELARGGVLEGGCGLRRSCTTTRRSSPGAA